MPGRPQRKARPPCDEQGHGAQACRDLGEMLGFEPAYLFTQFSAISLMLEFESNMPRKVAEWLAVRMMADVFDKRGRGTDVAS